MDWFLTLGLMAVCVLSAAVMSTTQNGFLNPHATEPFISRQLMDLAVGLGLAAAVAGCRVTRKKVTLARSKSDPVNEFRRG